MIVVKIELWSARTGKVSELGRMLIANDGTSKNPKRGNYDAKILRKGSFTKSWDSAVTTRESRVEDYPRLSYSVWRLVLRCLKNAFPEG